LELSFPHSTDIRKILFQVALDTEHIIQLFALDNCSFKAPRQTIIPSAFTQIVEQPKKIINPYITYLQRNYYYPILLEPLVMSTDNEKMTTEPNDSSNLKGHSPTAHSKPKATTKPTAITVEHSLDVIEDLSVR